MLIISAGLQKSGSALIFNIINDLIVYNGGSDVHLLKERYHLEQILRYHNCNVADFSWHSLRRLLAVSLSQWYVVKTHSGPTPLLKNLLRIGVIRAVVIVRDPRDVIISAMDHGMKLRSEGRNDTFAVCDTIGETVNQVKQWVATVSPWLVNSTAMIVKYEDLLQQQAVVVRKVAAYLSQRVDQTFIENTQRRYDPRRPDENVREILHYNKAVINRYKEILTPDELKFVNFELDSELGLLGYRHDS